MSDLADALREVDEIAPEPRLSSRLWEGLDEDRLRRLLRATNFVEIRAEGERRLADYPSGRCSGTLGPHAGQR